MVPFCSMVILMVLVGCAGPRSGSTEERDSRDVPPWTINSPTAEDAFYGVGQAKKQNPSLSRQTATARARAEISAAVNVKVSSMLKDYMSERGWGDNAQAIEFSESVIKQVSSNALEGAIIKETYTAKDGTVFVLVEYSLASTRQDGLNAAKNDEALYNEYKAREGFESLDREIEKLETK